MATHCKYSGIISKGKVAPDKKSIRLRIAMLMAVDVLLFFPNEVTKIPKGKIAKMDMAKAMIVLPKYFGNSSSKAKLPNIMMTIVLRRKMNVP